jgi:hypothetical protein
MDMINQAVVAFTPHLKYILDHPSLCDRHLLLNLYAQIEGENRYQTGKWKRSFIRAKFGI